MCSLGRAVVYSREKHSAGLGRACAQLPRGTTGSLVSPAGCEAPRPRVPAMQGPEMGCHACSGHMYRGMRFLPSCFPNPSPLLFYWCIAGPPSAPESKYFPTVPPNRCSGVLGSATSGFSRLAPWHWASPHIPGHLSSLCLPWTCSILIICSQSLTG